MNNPFLKYIFYPAYKLIPKIRSLPLPFECNLPKKVL